MANHAENVIDLLRNAQKDILIVAPYIRSDALSRLLDAIPLPEEVKLVTRWRAADVLTGASDLEVFDIAVSKNIKVYLHDTLHAKLFAADARCLVGSANVSYSALGWRTPSNLELLVKHSRTDQTIVDFERVLFIESRLATKAIRDRIRNLVDSLDGKFKTLNEKHQALDSFLPSEWVPNTRHPHDLYYIYVEQYERVRSISRESTMNELNLLHIVPNLDENAFRNAVSFRIIDSSLFSNVLHLIDVDREVTELALSRLLKKIGASSAENQASEVLITIERWLRYFFNVNYETTQDTIKLIQSTRL